MDERRGDDELSQALGRLPRWTPSEQFDRELAAAAARQVHRAADAGGTDRVGRVLAALNLLLPQTLLAGAVAAGLAVLPWSELVASPAETTLCAAVLLGGGGLWLLLRMLRSGA